MGNGVELTDKIAELRDLSEFLFDLAITVPEHCTMLFRLSDKAQAEADRLSNLTQQATG